MQINNISSFYAFVKQILNVEAGYYTRPGSQEKAIALFNKPRDVETTGLEVIICESFLNMRFSGQHEIECEVYCILLIQNPEDTAWQLQRALRKLQLNMREQGRIDELIIAKDEDFTQGTRKVIEYTVWLPRCECDYDVCEDGMVIDA